MTHRVKVFSNSITDGQASVLGLLEKSNFRKDAKKYIVNLKGVDDLSMELATKLNSTVLSLNEISDAADAIDEKNDAPVSVIKLEGDGGSNLAAFYKTLSLEKNTQYQYRYDLMTTGSAMTTGSTMTTGMPTDLFRPNIGQSPIYSSMDNVYVDTVYEEVAYVKDFTVSGADSGFFKTGKTSHGFTGSGFGVEYSGNKGQSLNYSCWVSFTMAAPGYAELDFFRFGGYSDTSTYSIKVNGVTYEGGSGSNVGKRLIFLDAGDHVIDLSGYSNGSVGLRKIKVGYTSMENNSFTPAKVVVKPGDAVTVSGSFKTEKQMLYNKSGKITFPVICETFQNAGLTELKDYITITNADSRAPWVFNIADRSMSMRRYNNTSAGTVTIKAPADKMVFISLKESYSCTRSVSGNAKELETGKYMIPAGGSLGLNYRSFTTGGRVSLSDIKVLFLEPNNQYGITEEAIYGDINAVIKDVTLSLGQTDWIGFDTNASLLGKAAFAFEKYTNIGQGSETINKVGFIVAGTEVMREAFISNFELFSTGGSRGNRIYVSDAFNSLKLLLDNGWQIEAMGRGSVTETLMNPPKIDETAPLIYKKGELVKYNIFYEDYENDPSKKQYWRYTHTPFNDGAHPEAAFILDEDGSIVTSTGAILPASIDRFYIDGKYMVEHWQEDDTSRGKVIGGNPDYDKLSNVERITFYIEGGAAAPWITSIGTVPATVREGEEFKIKVGVDDLEKDTLSLTTEVYLDRALIYTQRQKDIKADANGKYPDLYTDLLPDKAKTGTYEVVCTVRDQVSAGIDSYKFIVVSEGSIVGAVTHTDAWEKKRLAYNATHAGARGSNVFWPGESFVLSANVGGTPTKVTAQILQTDYFTTMKNTGKTHANGQAIYTGSLWDNTMLSRWRDAEGIEVVFRFSAYYAAGRVKTHDVKVILDNRDGAVLIHRVW